MTNEVLFLDDKDSRHRAFEARARAAGLRATHVRTPAATLAVLRDRGDRLAAVYLDRDLGLHETGEDVAEAMARLPVPRRSTPTRPSSTGSPSTVSGAWWRGKTQ